MVNIISLEQEIQEKKRLLAEKTQVHCNQNKIECDFRNRVAAALDRQRVELATDLGGEKRKKIQENIDKLTKCLTDSTARDEKRQLEIEVLEQEISKLQESTNEIAASITSKYKKSLPKDKQASFFSSPSKETLNTANKLCTKMISSMQPQI